MLALSDKWAPVLISQPETGMNFQIASIFLLDGRRFDNAMIVGGFITKLDESTVIPFQESEIAQIIVNHGREFD